jgi:hypothetical protein
MCTGKGLLAVQENFGMVAECDCGTIHVTVGPVSIALDSHALRQLHGMVGSAIERLDSASLESPKHRTTLTHSSHLALTKILKIKH